MPADANSEYWDTLRLNDEESAAEAIAAQCVRLPLTRCVEVTESFVASGAYGKGLGELLVQFFDAISVECSPAATWADISCAEHQLGSVERYAMRAVVRHAKEGERL